MSHPILVTGATGSVGSHVLKRLADAGLPVRAAIHTSARGGFIRNSAIEQINLDYADPDLVAAAVHGIKTLFLLTPMVPDMVAITRTMVEAARRAGVEYIVKLSVLGAGRNADGTLARWHTEAEQLVAQSGVAYTFLRPNTFMQNFVTYHEGSIRSHNAFFLPHGEGVISFVDARDVAAVAAVALSQPGHAGHTYHLTGPEALSNEEVAEILSRVSGRTIRYRDVSDEEERAELKHSGEPLWMVDAMMELHDVNRGGQAAMLYSDVEDVTGHQPGTFAEFAREHAPLFR